MSTRAHTMTEEYAALEKQIHELELQIQLNEMMGGLGDAAFIARLKKKLKLLRKKAGMSNVTDMKSRRAIEYRQIRQALDKPNLKRKALPMSTATRAARKGSACWNTLVAQRKRLCREGSVVRTVLVDRTPPRTLYELAKS